MKSKSVTIHTKAVEQNVRVLRFGYQYFTKYNLELILGLLRGKGSTALALQVTNKDLNCSPVRGCGMGIGLLC